MPITPSTRGKPSCSDGLTARGRRELTVDPDKVEIITDRFGKGATFLPFDGQQVRARVKVCKSQQFFGWVASMGRAVSIAAPQSLVEEYRDYLRFLLEE